MRALWWWIGPRGASLVSGNALTTSDGDTLTTSDGDTLEWS